MCKLTMVREMLEEKAREEAYLFSQGFEVEERQKYLTEECITKKDLNSDLVDVCGLLLQTRMVFSPTFKPDLYVLSGILFL